MMHVLTIGNEVIPYQVRFSPKARYKRIVVTPGGVEVVAPRGAAWDGPDGLHGFIHGKRRWVFDAVRKIEAQYRKLLTQRYDSGAKLQYRGRWLMLDVQPGPVAEVQIRCRSKFHVAVPASLANRQRLEAIRAAFHHWLRERALQDLHQLARRHESRLGVQAKCYRLSQARTRWGSCAADGTIRIHWRLVQAPKAAMEYVIAHELAHLIHRNHSPAFWNTLAETLPAWTEGKALLGKWEAAHRAV